MKKSVRHWPRLKLFSWCGPAGHHCHLCGSVGHQRGSFQRPCPRRQLAEGSCLLLQDRSGSGCGRHSRRSYTVNCWIQWLIYHNTDTNMASFNHRWFNLSTSSLSLRCFFFFFPRPPSSHYHLSGTGHKEDGQEERHRSQPPVSGDAGMHFCHLLRQNRNTDHQPDVSVQGEMTNSDQPKSAFTKLFFPTLWESPDKLTNWDTYHKMFFSNVHVSVCVSRCV